MPLPLLHSRLAGPGGHAAALLAGLLYPLGLAPLSLWPLALLATGAFLYLLQDLTPKRAALRGWWFGCGLYGSGASWVFVSIHEHGPAPVWLAALLTALFVAGLAVFFLLHGYLFRRLVGTRPLSLLLGFPALWVLMEWFRGWFMTGFPWLYLGYAPLDTWLAGWAPLGGVYALSLASSFSACALYLALSCARGWSARSGLGLAATLPWLIGYALSQHSWSHPQADAPLQVSLVQGNIPQALKWDPRNRLTILDTYLQLSETELGRDLIVWPETAIPMFADQASPLLAAWSQRLSDAGTTLVSGLPHREMNEQAWRYHNSVIALGAGEGIYHKQRLVPFGEYVPLESLLRGLIRFFDLPMSSFSLGPHDQLPLRGARREQSAERSAASAESTTEPQPDRTTHENKQKTAKINSTERVQNNRYRIAASICYEIVYPDLIAKHSRDSDLLLTISNDSWFGDSWAPQQHQQMARMRALENQRYLVRATNNGISALIGPDGALLSESRQFEQLVARGEVRLMTGLTPFTRWGSLPALLFSAVLLALALPATERMRPRLRARA